MVYGLANSVSSLQLPPRIVAHVVIEHEDAVGAERCLDKLGALRVVALLHVTFIVEAAHSRWPIPERRPVYIEPQWLPTTQVLNPHRMRHKARRLSLASWQRPATISKWSLKPGREKFDLCLYGVPMSPGSQRAADVSHRFAPRCLTVQSVSAGCAFSKRVV
jgi:hypothetical protein